ncbi:MAG: hypothetical protein AAF355_15780 [Myxococcota bacterium]
MPLLPDDELLLRPGLAPNGTIECTVEAQHASHTPAWSGRPATVDQASISKAVFGA